MQLRVEDGEATLKTRKGLDWSDKFPAIAKEGGALPDALIDGEIVALDHNGAAGLFRAAGGDFRRQDRRSHLLRFDLLFAGGEDLRALPLVERKERLKQLLEARKGKAKLIRYVEHFDEAARRCCNRRSKLSLEGIVSKKRDAPYRSGRTESWTKANAAPGMRS